MLKGLQDNMKTGNEEIDQQHLDLLRKVDDLLKAARAQRGEEEITRLLWFLKRYVRTHFRDEEKLQLNSGYPGYRVHKLEHDGFFNEVRRLEGRYAAEGASTVLIVQAVVIMSNWLRNHFHEMDRDFIEFLHKK